MKNNFQSIRKSAISTPLAFLLNIVLVYIIYGICRIAYIMENWSTFSLGLFDNSWEEMLTGCWYFDTSAILYTNALYALMMLFPVHYKETIVWQKIAKWIFVIANSITIAMNLADSVYFRYSGKRTTCSVIQEFQNENNIGKIFSSEVINHWYLFVLGLILIYSLWRLYVPTTKKDFGRGWKNKIRYYIVHTLIFLIYLPLTIGGMRGGFTAAVRPITISNANQYVNNPTEAAAILNTPFSLIRTTDQASFKDPGYKPSEIDGSYSPLHKCSSNALNKRNIVVLIVESFCKQYVEEGYAPFVKSLQDKSLTFEYSFANGRKSIDAMPSILSSIPMFVEPFFLTPASMNNVSGIAGEVDKLGYQTAFFHGAENGSMGFEAFSRATGFQKYFGRTEYNNDKRFNGDKDFDGTWAIWDEPFLQFYSQKMTEMKQPFMTAVFTASSHHPFNIPEKYEGIYKNDGPNSMHRCIMYTDMAIRKFFENASKQPWYKNTIFVLTCDHTNGFDQPEYGTDLGLYAATLLFYDPTGQIIKPEHRHCIAQQIDIMPTLMNLIGYNEPYIAFGQDIISTKDADTWAVNYNNGIYQFIKGESILQFDGNNVVGYYNFKKDPLLKNNLANHIGVDIPDVKYLKAIIQDYMRRMVENRLIVKQNK